MFARKKSLSSVPLLVFVNAALVLMAGESRVRSDDQPAPADAIKEALDKAKNECSSKIDTIRKEVLQSLDSKITAARKKKNNSAIVASLRLEKETFEKDLNQLPLSLGRARPAFENRKRRARIVLAEAYVRAAHDYTKEGNDAAAKAVKAEQAQFLLDNSILTPYQRPPAGADQVPAIPRIPAQLMINPVILVHSEWNFTRQLDVVNQGGDFKILDGVIYHLDANFPIGEAALDAAGQLHLSFRGHRKIPEGEAVVRKVANGEFRGVLIFGGDLWGFSMSRR